MVTWAKERRVKLEGIYECTLTYSAAMSAIIIFYMAVTPLLAKRYCAKGFIIPACYCNGLIIPFRPDINITAVKYIHHPG